MVERGVGSALVTRGKEIHGIFTEAAARLAQAGLEVLVVSRIAALSKRLTLAAHRIVVFPWPDLAVEAA